MTIDLDELERLEKAATRGPWARRLGTSAVHQPRYECWIPQNEADADLIAATRNALPVLLASARRCADLERERDALRADFERYSGHGLCSVGQNCPKMYVMGRGCTCGLDEARRRWSRTP